MESYILSKKLLSSFQLLRMISKSITPTMDKIIL